MSRADEFCGLSSINIRLVDSSNTRERSLQRGSRYHRAFTRWSVPSVVGHSFNGIRVITLSNLVKVALPPLFIASLPKRAIGFSYPRGREGQALGISLLILTVTLSLGLSRSLGLLAIPLAFWVIGGTSAVVMYNCATRGMAFVKELCSTCRLRPLIEEHEAMHLEGEGCEGPVWTATKQRYSYDGLGLGNDPRICSFCPIAKHLKEN